MKLSKIIINSAIVAASIITACNANAGVTATTANSRANCINNESVTWWLGHPYNWRVVSTHSNIYGGGHLIDTGYSNTWRQAAIHWNEAPLDDHRWYVAGYHYLAEYASGRTPFAITYAINCNIYDGWWDH